MSDKTSPVTNLPRVPSAERLCSRTTTLNSPSRRGVNMYRIAKATLAAAKKQSQQCYPHHLSAVAFTNAVIQNQVEVEISEERRWATYRWDSPRRWWRWLQGGQAGTAYILRAQGEKAKECKWSLNTVCFVLIIYFANPIPCCASWQLIKMIIEEIK